MSAMPRPLVELRWFEGLVASASRECRDEMIRVEGPHLARALGAWFGGPVQVLTESIAHDLATLPAHRMAALCVALGDELACGWPRNCDARVLRLYTCLAWWLREVAKTLSPRLALCERVIDIPDETWTCATDVGWIRVVLARLWDQERHLLGDGSSLTVESITALAATHPHARAERPGWMALRWAVGTGKLAKLRSVAGNVTTENEDR